MLLFKLKLMENVLKKNGDSNTEQLKAALKLEKLVLEVNFNVEEVPEYSYGKTRLLLSDINGKALSFEEQKLLKIIIDKP